MRVLCVDDSEMNRRILTEMLRAGDIDVSEADGGVAALRIVETLDFDFMDLRMPEMDGLAATGHIRARHDNKAGVPLIMVTADDGLDVDAICRAGGADDVLHKPVGLDALFASIARVLLARADHAVLLT